MYLTIKVENVNKEQMTDIEEAIINNLSSKGYKYDIFKHMSQAFIKSEIEFRNENAESSGLKRKLTENEVNELTDKLFDDTELFTNFNEVLESEIHKILEE